MNSPRHRGLCLVLGGCGFLGSNLVEGLIAAHYGVRVLDVPTASRINLASMESAIAFREGDFLHEGDIDSALQDIDFVFHLVGTTLPANSNNRPVFDIESNVVGTIRLLDACRRHGVKRVVFASSGGTVYGESRTVPIPEDHPTDPLCSYGITKLAIEKYLRLYSHLYGLDYAILRVANPYGRHQRIAADQGVVGVFLARISEGKTITIWGDGSVTRDYVYVKDVANAFVKALTQSSPYRVFNIGSGVGTTLRELLARMEQVTGIKPRVEYTASRPIDVSVNILDSTRAREHMHWHAETDLDAGLRKTWSWLRGDGREASAGSRAISTKG